MTNQEKGYRSYEKPRKTHKHNKSLNYTKSKKDPKHILYVFRYVNQRKLVFKENSVLAVMLDLHYVSLRLIF